jgi:hypothetical protein
MESSWFKRPGSTPRAQPTGSGSRFRPHEQSPYPVLWAERAFRIPSGHCLGLQLRGRSLWVAFAKAERSSEWRWVPAHEVLTNEDAIRWSKHRFVKR